MLIAPNTNIYLLKCPLELDNKNQLTFNSKQEQFEFFYNLPKLQLNNSTYQRKEGVLRWNGNFEKVINYNYVMYQNSDFNDKWFYAFITNIKYVNDNLTTFTLVTDCFQTWQFDITFRQSFVEREMINVSDDIPGANLLPEGLETGEYTIAENFGHSLFDPVWCVAYIGTKIGDTTLGEGAFIVNGISQTVSFLIATTLTAYNQLMERLNGDVTTDSNNILSCFSIPRLAVVNFLTPDHQLGNYNNVYFFIGGNEYNQPETYFDYKSLPSSLDGYTPRNQKLRTYPYIYFGICAPNTSEKIYRYENFNNHKPSFGMISEVNQNPQVCIIPQNYRGIEENIADASYMTGYPTLSSRSDTFNSWLAQNNQTITLQKQQLTADYQLNNIANAYNGTSGAIGNVATLNIPGAFESVGNSAINQVQNQFNYDYAIKNQMAQVEKQSMIPDTR